MVSGHADPVGWKDAVAENAAVLRDIAAKGADVSRPRVVDFAHVFRDMQSARTFADEVAREGYAVEIRPYVDGDFPWDATASKEMAPTAEAITAVENDLNYYATLYGGRADGWGFYSSPQVASEIDQA